MTRFLVYSMTERNSSPSLQIWDEGVLEIQPHQAWQLPIHLNSTEGMGVPASYRIGTLTELGIVWQQVVSPGVTRDIGG